MSSLEVKSLVSAGGNALVGRSISPFPQQRFGGSNWNLTALHFTQRTGGANFKAVDGSFWPNSAAGLPVNRSDGGYS